MELIQIIILGIIQGLTEFLPVSSSGHLILTPLVLNLKDQGLALDAILHLGTLMAILIFFKKDLFNIFLGLFDKRRDTHRVAWCIVAASFPAGLIGLFFGDWIESSLRNPTFVAVNLLFWSLILYMADRSGKSEIKPKSELQELNFSQIFFIGCAQAIALLPGTSRSGITIAAGLFSNLNHITATNALQQYTNLHLIVGLGISFLVGLLAIKLLLKVVEKLGLFPFIVYRVLLAAAILFYYHG